MVSTGGSLKVRRGERKVEREEEEEEGLIVEQ